MTVVPVAEKSQQPAATCFRRVEFQLQNYTAKTLLHDSKPAVKNFKTWWKFLENNLYVELISMHTMHLMPPCDLIKTIHFACKNNSKNSLRVGSYKATLLLATCVHSASDLTRIWPLRPVSDLPKVKWQSLVRLTNQWNMSSIDCLATLISGFGLGSVFLQSVSIITRPSRPECFFRHCWKMRSFVRLWTFWARIMPVRSAPHRLCRLVKLCGHQKITALSMIRMELLAWLVSLTGMWVREDAEF